MAHSSRLPIQCVAVLAASLWVLPAAADQSGGYSASLMLGYRDGGRFEATEPDGSERLRGSAAAGMVLGYEFEPGSFWELSYLRQNTSLGDDGPDVSIGYLQVGGRLDFGGHPFVPYLSGGIGVTRISARNQTTDSALRPGMSLAGGLEWPLAERLAVGVEARGHLTLTGGDRGILCVSEPGDAFCRLAWRGDVLTQFELLAGLTLRF